MKKEITLAAVILSILMPMTLTLTLPTAVWANHHEKMTPAEMEKKLDKMAKELNLTQDQKNQVRALKEEKHRKMEDAGKECKDKIRALLNPEQQSKFDKMMQDKD